MPKPITSPEELLQRASRILSGALADYEAPGISPHAVEFYEVRVQAAIFNYDITREFVALWQHEPQGFALNVSLKDLVHKLYEYDKALTGRLVGRLLSLAAARGVAIQAADLREERKRWKAQLSRLGKWSEVRNSATGHYSSDISKQVRLLKQLNRGEIVDVAAAVLTYNGAILKLLAKVGQG